MSCPDCGSDSPAERGPRWQGIMTPGRCANRFHGETPEAGDRQAARRETPRGFTVYDEFTDRYGCTVRVQQSSLATDDCVWVFCAPEGGKTENASPHLTVEMAVWLRDALQAFISERGGSGGYGEGEED